MGRVERPLLSDPFEHLPPKLIQAFRVWRDNEDVERTINIEVVDLFGKGLGLVPALED
jgi:hypothetical protein